MRTKTQRLEDRSGVDANDVTAATMEVAYSMTDLAEAIVDSTQQLEDIKNILGEMEKHMRAMSHRM
jgi:hypothetical protein